MNVSMQSKWEKKTETCNKHVKHNKATQTLKQSCSFVSVTDFFWYTMLIFAGADLSKEMKYEFKHAKYKGLEGKDCPSLH